MKSKKYVAVPFSFLKLILSVKGWNTRKLTRAMNKKYKRTYPYINTRELQLAFNNGTLSKDYYYKALALIK